MNRATLPRPIVGVCSVEVDLVCASVIDSKRRIVDGCDLLIEQSHALIDSCMCHSQNGPNERNQSNIASHKGKDPMQRTPRACV